MCLDKLLHVSAFHMVFAGTTPNPMPLSSGPSDLGACPTHWYQWPHLHSSLSCTLWCFTLKIPTSYTKRIHIVCSTSLWSIFGKTFLILLWILLVYQTSAPGSPASFCPALVSCQSKWIWGSRQRKTFGHVGGLWDLSSGVRIHPHPYTRH